MRPKIGRIYFGILRASTSLLSIFSMKRRFIKKSHSKPSSCCKETTVAQSLLTNRNALIAHTTLAYMSFSFTSPLSVYISASLSLSLLHPSLLLAFAILEILNAKRQVKLNGMLIKCYAHMEMSLIMNATTHTHTHQHQSTHTHTYRRTHI